MNRTANRCIPAADMVVVAEGPYSVVGGCTVARWSAVTGADPGGIRARAVMTGAGEPVVGETVEIQAYGVVDVRY